MLADGVEPTHARCQRPSRLVLHISCASFHPFGWPGYSWRTRMLHIDINVVHCANGKKNSLSSHSASEKKALCRIGNSNKRQIIVTSSNVQCLNRNAPLHSSCSCCCVTRTTCTQAVKDFVHAPSLPTLLPGHYTSVVNPDNTYTSPHAQSNQPSSPNHPQITPISDDRSRLGKVNSAKQAKPTAVSLPWGRIPPWGTKLRLQGKCFSDGRWRG